MDPSEKSPEEEWEDHFNELVNKLNKLFNSVELISGEDLNFKHGDMSSTKEEVPSFIKLIENCNPREVPIFYSGQRFVYIRDLENQYSKSPFFLFMSMEELAKEEKASSLKIGLIVTEYCGFVLIGTFNNSNSANAVRFFCNYVTETLSQYEMIEE